MGVYTVTKTYGHETGLSCVFRQPKAESHCRFLHGYALSFKFVFSATELDERNWVVDFGAFKRLKERLHGMFDHTIVLAVDDPHRNTLADMMADLHVGDIRILPAVGCEAFAKWAYNEAKHCLITAGVYTRVRVLSCTVAEHGANSATYLSGED